MSDTQEKPLSDAELVDKWLRITCRDGVIYAGHIELPLKELRQILYCARKRAAAEGLAVVVYEAMLRFGNYVGHHERKGAKEKAESNRDMEYKLAKALAAYRKEGA